MMRHYFMRTKRSLLSQELFHQSSPLASSYRVEGFFHQSSCYLSRILFICPAST